MTRPLHVTRVARLSPVTRTHHRILGPRAMTRFSKPLPPWTGRGRHIKIRDGVTERCAMHGYALGASPGTASGKREGRKEIQLKDLDEQTRQKFLGLGGSDEKEWHAWWEKDAVEVLSLEESQRIRRNHPELIVPTRWVRTKKERVLKAKLFRPRADLSSKGSEIEA